MKSFIQMTLIAGLAIAFIGCDATKDAVDKTKEAGANAAEAVGDMANIDFGDFDMTGLKDKFTGITSGLKDVTADTAGDVVDKIKGLTSSIGDMGIGDLTGPAKTAVGEAISKFVDTVKSAIANISDEGILSQLKPAVDALMEKVKAFM